MGGDYSGLEGFSGAGSFEIMSCAAGRKGATNSTYISTPFAEWGVAAGFINAAEVASLYLYLKNKWGL